ncbi:hypothetical protein CCP3SC1AL1_1810004 [Gammaproteobacteria bacterium]
MGKDLFADSSLSKPKARDLFDSSNNESIGLAALKAPYRVGEDLYKGLAGAIKSIPGYLEQAKTEVPGAWGSLIEHPERAAAQLGAGVTEMGHNLLNVPRGLANYASNRLNLLPQEYANKVPYQQDISQDINNVFGEPKYEGEKFIRGVGRNALNIAGGAGLARNLNPLNLTNSGIARNVVREQRRQEGAHTNQYNRLWEDAERAGIDNVPVSNHLIDTNLAFIRQYKSPRDYRGLEYFREHPTLPNAQSATSDLKGIMRSLDEKSKSSSLTTEERHLYDAADHTVRHIEGNMFLNADGTVNQRLADRHRGINTSYRENVVPYRYNKNIQNYIDEKSTAPELVNSLSKGEFARKKGWNHPAIKIRNAVPKAVLGTGSIGGLGWLIKQMFGNNEIVE